MAETLTELSLVGQFLKCNLRYFLTGKWRLAAGHIPNGRYPVPEDYFGIRVASSPDPSCDDYVVERLRELELRNVRLDFSYSNENSYTKPFLDRLMDEGFHVCLHLIQPFEEARAMKTPEAKARWRGFLTSILDHCKGRVEMVEIGSTCNRRKWAGYSLSSFMTLWNIAYEEISKRGILLAGPNITDFEPLYNIGLLGIMKKSGMLPAVHSDNLFAERATEPEAFDHKIGGHFLRPVIKFNLVKKVRFLAGISDYYNIPHTICAHVAWSLRRINRILNNLEEKQADYLARYCCLAAASGGLKRVYWGPLIGQREGLIDDGTSEFPELPHVTFYGKANGEVEHYRIRPAFHAYRTVIKLLSGAEFKQTLVSVRGLEVHEFVRGNELMHVGWTTNGNCASISDCYEEKDMRSASVISRDGKILPEFPSIFCESPTYILWTRDCSPHFRTSPEIMPDVRISQYEDGHYKPVDNDKWEGVFTFTSGDAQDVLSHIPEDLEKGDDRKIMRDGRNCVWSMPDTRNPSRTIVVKRHQVRKLHKKLVQRWKPSGALRSWNGANELLRRGISTPRPIAFFQRHKRPSLSDSYFVYGMFQNTGSMRQAFRAFKEGETEFHGISRGLLYSELADFLHEMHGRGVFFRDLSAGNMLFRIKDNGQVEFCLIDTARAHFYTHSLSLRLRLSDLKRITHPANWKCRKEFMAMYMNKMGRNFSWWMKIPLICYDLKHMIKHQVKRKR